MKKVEYPEQTVLNILRLINSMNIKGLENIKKINIIINLLDSGIPKNEEENNGNNEQRELNHAD